MSAVGTFVGAADRPGGVLSVFAQARLRGVVALGVLAILALLARPVCQALAPHLAAALAGAPATSQHLESDGGAYGTDESEPCCSSVEEDRALVKLSPVSLPGGTGGALGVAALLSVLLAASAVYRTGLRRRSAALRGLSYHARSARRLR